MSTAKNVILPERSNSDEILQNSRVASLFDAIERNNEGMVIVNAESRIVWMNERYANRFGATQSTVIGRNVEEIIPNSMMRWVVQSGKPILLDIMSTDKGPLVVMRLPITDENNRVLGAIGIALCDDLKAISPLCACFAKREEARVGTKEALARERKAKYSFDSIIGKSPSILSLQEKARRAAALNCPILITGETGTGKELLAHAIHGASGRAHGPLVCINMGAIPATLIEAEFFGVAPGAFTDALKSGKLGKLELAKGGTLFLDEIANLPYALQGKLLRVIQEKEYEAVGSNKISRTNIRLIAATSSDLLQAMEKKRFRADLYYRLNVVSLHLPPLRERKECLPVLTKHFIGLLSREIKNCCGVEDDAMELLGQYHWPGNIRELRNVLERAAMFAEGQILTAEDLRPHLGGAHMRSDAVLPAQKVSSLPGNLRYAEAMRKFEEGLLRETLAEAGDNVALAAKKLGIGRSTLYKRLLLFCRA